MTRLLRIGAAAGVLVLAGLLGWRLTHQNTATARAILHDKVVRAPLFRLPRLTGAGDVSLASFRGRPVVLNFWASDCIPCKKEMPQLEAAYRRWTAKGLVVFGVDEEYDRFAGRDFLHAHAVTYPNAHDKLLTVAGPYGLFGTPTTFFIDRRGFILKRVVGPVSDRELETQIRRISA
jgi:cytochrome c biogenesis protein CcmG, thiol:disulfide interchange protein DsbE